MAAKPQVKGLAFLGILKAAERLHGAPVLEAIKKELPAPLTGLLVTGNWYPIDLYRELLTVTSKVLGHGPAAIRAVSREATLQDFRGIYRVLTFVLSPEFLMKRAPGMFNRYYDTGKLEILEARDGLVRAQYTECAGFNRLMWEDVIGGSAGVLEACGGRDIQVHIARGGSDDDAHLQIDATWT
jgi:hypothetical protein